MSGSAVLPPKRPPRSPLKLQLPGTATPEENAGGRPKLSLNPAPTPQPTTSSGRPSLKLPGLTAGVAGLSLAIPQKVAGRYSKALDRANVVDDSENDLESDDDDDNDEEGGGHGLWAAGEQERMAGELLDVINGAPAGELEDELSGRTRRPRSNSRFAAVAGSAATSSATAPANGREPGQTRPAVKKGGEHALLSPPPAFGSPPSLAASSTTSSSSSSPPPAATTTTASSNNAPLLNFYGDHVRAALQPTPSLHSIPLESPPLQGGGPAGTGSERSGPSSRSSRGSPGAATSKIPHDGLNSVVGTGVDDGSNEPLEPEEEEEEDGTERHDGKLDISPQTIKDLGRLGEGASGEVRRVLHVPSQIVMAKKTITTSPNPKVHKQHLRELLFMRDCTHPNIVQYYGAYLESNNTEIGICMEFCEAGSLERLYKRVQQKGYRTGEKVLGKIAESILEGLVYLHSQKIIHRDIKPSNVLVTRDGLIKLCDFGVSGELVDSLAGTFVGTTYYLSPERIRGAQYSINSDVWSMAVTVLEVALNRFPFPGPGEAPLNGPIELLTYLMKMEKIDLPDEPAVGIKYTNAFRNFIQVCLDKDPATRPGPQALQSHGWIRRSRERQPPADLASWVRGLDAA
ncbi:hypothetical protein JCM3774_000815 [Rhodotorula dairenensis]